MELDIKLKINVVSCASCPFCRFHPYMNYICYCTATAYLGGQKRTISDDVEDYPNDMPSIPEWCPFKM